jgi:DNA (cytosine-5)-methyltransferase 1
MKETHMYKTVDLFAGVGGIRRGFELAGGFENVLSADIDKYASQTYEHLHGEESLNDVTSEDFKVKVEETDYHVLLGGFPCQSFSRAGKQEGFLNATKGTLFFDVADIIKRTRPRTFLLENVDNLLAHDGGNTFKTIAETLVHELNYKVIGVDEAEDGTLSWSRESFKRNSKNFGLPQNRPRVYIMGFDKEYFGEKTNLLADLALPESRERGAIFETVDDILEKDVDAKYFAAEGYIQSMKNHRDRHSGKGNGFGFVVVNAADRKSRISNAVLATGGSGKERNLIHDPRPDVIGLTVKGKKSPISSEGIRHMTPLEWARLQGFAGYGFIDENGVDQFSFPDNMSNTQRYKQMGNSVTIPVIEEMALFMKTCLTLMGENLDG